MLKDKPGKIIIDITSACNLRCKYCSHFSTDASNVKDIEKDRWIEFFNELGELKINQVTLAGGEPFIREDITEIIEGLVSNSIYYVILSNGSLITDKLANFISKSGYCKSVQISLDGSDNATHDHFRGEGSFLAALNGISILKRHNIFIDISVTIHRKNYNKIPQLADFVFNTFDQPHFKTNSANFFGKCRFNSEDVQMTVSEYQAAMHSLVLLNQKYKGKISGNGGPLADVLYWSKMLKAANNKEPPFSTCGYLSGCTTFFNDLSVLANGTIVPCLQLSHIPLGTINEQKLLDVWKNSKTLNSLRDREKIPLSTFKMCGSCKYIRFCTGNCPALAYSETGDMNKPSYSGCLKLFLEQGGQVPQI